MESHVLVIPRKNINAAVINAQGIPSRMNLSP